MVFSSLEFVNIGLLGFFKYANFFVEQMNSLGLGTIAWTSIALPIGISLFRFQSMSYTIDVARGRSGHITNPINFALYVALLPQLIAGPIARFHEIAEEIVDWRDSQSVDWFVEAIPGAGYVVVQTSEHGLRYRPNGSTLVDAIEWALSTREVES